MASLVKFLATLAIATTAVMALPAAGHDLTLRQSDTPFCQPCPLSKYCECDPSKPPTSASSPAALVARTEVLECFPRDGTGMKNFEWEPAIENFCHKYDGTNIIQNTAVTETSQPIPGNNAFLSLTNPFCPAGVSYSYDMCKFYFTKLLNVCSGGNGIIVGGTVTLDCGIVMMQHSYTDGHTKRSEKGMAVADTSTTPSPSLLARTEILQCFPFTGTGLPSEDYMDPIHQFAQRYNGATLHQNTAFTETYQVNGDTVYLSVTNPYCPDGDDFGYDGTVYTFNQILDGCDTPEGDRNVGGTVTVDCGIYMLQHNPPADRVAREIEVD